MTNLDIFDKRILDGLKNIESIPDASFSLRQFCAFVGLDHPQKLSNRLAHLEEENYVKKDNDGIYHVIRNYLTHMINIPFYGWSQCGNVSKSILEEKPKDFLQFDFNVLELTENDDVGKYFFTKAKGKSMLPRIKEDDLLLVREEGYMANDAYIYLVIHHGEAKIKKIQSKGDSSFLVSINDTYAPLEIDPFDDSIKVIGSVKKIITSY